MFVFFTVPVSKPAMSVIGGTLLLGQSFQLRCHSDTGTLPITYVLFGPSNLHEVREVTKSGESAIFNPPPIFKRSDLDKFRCNAQNNGRKSPLTGLGEQLQNSTRIIGTKRPVWPVNLFQTMFECLYFFCTVQSHCHNQC